MSVISNASHVLIPFCCVQQHTTMMSNSKSYVCPVCGRALSSPGSLGRHLLIHSEDRLSNCAVCGARFTDTSNFNRFGSSPLSVWQDARPSQSFCVCLPNIKADAHAVFLRLKAKLGYDVYSMWFSVHLSFFYVIDDIHSYSSTVKPLKQESLMSVFLFMKKPADIF